MRPGTPAAAQVPGSASSWEEHVPSFMRAALLTLWLAGWLLETSAQYGNTPSPYTGAACMDDEAGLALDSMDHFTNCSAAKYLCNFHDVVDARCRATCVQWHSHVFRHVHSHVFRHVHSHVFRPVHRHVEYRPPTSLPAPSQAEFVDRHVYAHVCRHVACCCARCNLCATPVPSAAPSLKPRSLASKRCSAVICSMHSAAPLCLSAGCDSAPCVHFISEV